MLLRDLGHRCNEADTLVHLRDTFDASGDTAAARDSWLAALTMFTDLAHPDADPVRTRLRNIP